MDFKKFFKGSKNKGTQRTVTVGGKEYPLCSPSLATLAMASDFVNEIPSDIPEDSERMVQIALAYAKDCKPLGKLAAVLILGAKRVKKNKKEFEQLSENVLTDMNTSALAMLIADRLNEMQIPDVFSMVTTLSRLNMLHATKDEA